MTRGLIRGLLTAGAAALFLAQPHAGAVTPAPVSPVLQRFLATDDSPPLQYRALRHLDARNDHFNTSAWMDVWTEVGPAGFQYQVAAQGGSDYIRSHVFEPSLDTERRMWASGDPDRAGLTPANYDFEDRGAEPDGLAWLGVKPRHRAPLLVDGSIFVRPDDGELVRMEGQLVKPPSFWTRRVHIVRTYERVAGVRMPVRLDTDANVLIAGRSTFRVSYEYESVNGERIGAPTVRSAIGTSSGNPK